MSSLPAKTSAPVWDADGSLFGAVCRSLRVPMMVVEVGAEPACVVSRGFLDLWGFGPVRGSVNFEEIRRASREQLREPVLFDAIFLGLNDDKPLRLDLLNGKTRFARCEVLKDSEGKALGRIVYFWDSDAQQLADQVVARKQAATRQLQQLSVREQEVADLVFEGRTNKWIAMNKGISVKTVEKHRARLMQKLGAESIAELIRAMTLAKLGED